ncbi:hypothetical protein CDL12_24497 [Handroanthus impetiginosus]|uniref:Uncharacterized protein n=1 Tax=Handroanthus impetiginosus TaxID=429701 RepID=A0A2G9GCG6_9LAMI|nr:hypothetical protein CDL12_24497 [Handroanthus impetiginosus]
MYVTRPRSLYRKFPGALSVRPQPDDLYSGHLVVSDEESEAMDSCCFGIWRNDRISRLPFPSDKILEVVHSSIHEEASTTKVWFLPVLDQSLSSNRYYVIKAKGRHKGQAYTCRREGDTGSCCFKTSKRDPKIRPFDYRDRYQQFEIHRHHSGGFFAKSIEWDGYPPNFLKRGGWEVYATPFKIHLNEAPGLRFSSTFECPVPNLPLHAKRSTPVVLGKWYSPFIFIKEGDCRIHDQMRKSSYYELSLKQWWEQIYYTENVINHNNVVFVDARVKRLLCLVFGMEGERDGGEDGEGFVWFKVKEGLRKRGSVGLSSVFWEKMKWLQRTRGWFDGEREVRLSGEKEIESESGSVWRKFGCYVLVESFVVRRMDGSLVINFNFRNTDKIECRWE